MKQRKWKRALAGTMSLAMILASLYVVPVFAETSGDEPTEPSAAAVTEEIGTNEPAQEVAAGEDVADVETTEVIEPVAADVATVPDGGVTEPAEGDAVQAPEAAIALQSEDDGIVALSGGHDMDIAGMTDFSKDKTAGTEVGDSTGYFTLICHGNTIVKGNEHSFTDGVTTTKQIDLGGTGKTTAASIKFTTTAAAEVVVHWVCAGNERQIVIMDDKGSKVATSSEGPENKSVKDTAYVTTFNLDTAGTYYLGSSTSSNSICALSVVEEGNVSTEEKHSMDIAGMTDFSKDKTAGTEVGDSTGYFTLICHGNTIVKGNEHSFTDGVTTTKQIDLGGTGKTTAASIKFTTTAAAEVVVHWVCAGNERQIVIMDDKGSKVATSSEGPENKSVKDTAYVTTFNLDTAGTYYLGSSTSSNSICALDVIQEGTSAIKVTVTPTITGLEDGQTVALVKSGKETVLTSNEKVELATGTYELIVKKAGQEDKDYRATVDGKTSVKISEDTTAIAVTVSTAYANPVVKLAEGSLSAEGNTITVTNKADAADTATLTVGQPVRLTIDATYTLSTAADSKTKATTDSKAEFKVTAGMAELPILIESTVVSAQVKLFDQDGVKDQITALTLSDGKSFSVDLKALDGQSVELVIGTEYTLTVSTDATDLTVELNGGKSVKAAKDTTALNVVLGKVTEGLYVIDLSGGLKKGVEYDGGISVLEDMGVKDSGKYVQGSGNPTISGTGAKGDVPDAGAVLVLKAQQDGRVKINLLSAGGKNIYFVSETGGQLDTFVSNSDTTLVYKVEEGNTYYFYGNGTKIKLGGVTVDYRPAVDWSTVEDPVLNTPTAAKPGEANEGSVTVPYVAKIGGIYSDSLQVRVLQNGEIIETVDVLDETDIVTGYAGVAAISGLPASGDYTIQAALKRSGEKEKLSNVVALNGYVLPMATPVIVNVESQGSGNVKFSWQEVPEAATYNVYLNGQLAGSTADVYYRFSGLTAGTEYEFGVEAVGNGDISERSSQKATVTGEAKKNWLFAAFGSGASTKTDENSYSGSFDTGDLSVWSLKGKGKLVPASTDGLAFYYTTIDPETENFTLTADVTVDNWTYSNGQEGFGLMAADNVGTHGDSSVFWNNSYMLSVTKVEYSWDPLLEEVSDSGTKYTMRLGIGAQEKTGVTPENLPSMQDGTGINEFVTNMYTLEHSAAVTPANDGVNEYLPSGSYNMVGGFTSDPGFAATNAGLQTTFHMVLQRNNTGYFLSYTDQNGVTTTKKFYHGDDGDELAKLDPNNIYVGFFASRYAKVKIENASLTTIAPENDAPAEERPIQYVTPKVGFESSKVSNSLDYELVYYGNADGKLYIECEGGDMVTDFMEVKADTKYRFNTKLRPGKTVFAGYFQPDTNYKPSKYEELLSYEPITFSITVQYKESQRNIYYVSPENAYWGTGDKNNPMDIYTAVSLVKPGDSIVLMEGTYNLDRTITIDRGIDGTADAMIYMIADPEATSRPVLDFGGSCPGMVMAGDYWYFQGFDVTRSSASDKGIQVSGSYNTLDNLRAYRNGNTGIQISRYKGTDLWEDWPSNNLILNCTSYLNADPGYEDADGFAAKLTIADGNVFDGCIAAYNADDGWDLFAKIESGPIGRVEIRNSVAFKNGYDIGADGQEIVAGNGNGFKMGGSSITGYHTLKNSVAFGNRAKGIDSNSCPDIQVYNSTSFNNESNNVAFYTNDAKNTDFFADGIVSYKTDSVKSGYGTGENLKLLGTQDESKVNGKTNYYWKGSKSINTAKVEVTPDWFVNMDMDAAIHGGICRNADGTINMNGFLVLTDAAAADAGARMTGTASENVVLPELIVPSDDDEDDAQVSAPAEEPEAPAAAPEKKPGKKAPTSSGSDKKPVTPTESGDKTGATTKKLVIDKDMDWSEAEAALDELLKNAKGDAVLDVTLGAYKVLDKEMVTLLQGKNVTLHLGLQNGVAWDIKGGDIKDPKEVNMNVALNSKNIPQDAIDEVAQGNDVIEFSLDHEGEFGFTAKMIFPVGSKNNGKFANLFYYNQGSSEFEYQSSCEVKDGNAEFSFSHASDYLVVLTETAMNGVPEKAPAEQPAVSEPSSQPETGATPDGALASATVASTGSSSNVLPIILIIIAVVVIGGIAVAVVMNKKKAN
ncbi:MAG: fibronectin type III domain-containing protein [Bacteroides sp.]|nr:fibronectin type III domain-containing protein [Bacteroides sp.]